jgi:predicted nucleotidyltransferase
MELDKDFKEFLVLLNQNEVEYLVVGGYAVAFHGYPRFTGDFNIWANGTNYNLEKLIKAIEQFGFESGQLKNIDFEHEVVAFHLGTPPVRIDIMNKISGVKFTDCYQRKEELSIDGLTIHYIGYDDLIKNKKASGRHKDLSDIENLQ